MQATHTPVPLTLSAALHAWIESVAPMAVVRRKGFTGDVRSPGPRERCATAARACVSTALLLMFVVATVLFVSARVYAARRYNHGVPGAAALLATLFHPMAGLFVLFVSGAATQNEEDEPNP